MELRPEKVIVLHGRWTPVKMTAKAFKQFRKRTHWGQDYTLVPLASPDNLGVEASKVSEVMRDNGTALARGIAQVLLVSKSRISFEKRVSSIIAALFERVRQMDVDILIQIDPDA